MENKRKYKHPLIDHTFEIKDISNDEIEIDGIRLHKKDCEGLVTMSNHSMNHNNPNSDYNVNDLALPILQHVLVATNKVKKLDNLLKDAEKN